MDAESYIARFGHTLSDAEKRYIRAFGPPKVAEAGPSRNPATPGLRVGSALDEAAHGSFGEPLAGHSALDAARH